MEVMSQLSDIYIRNKQLDNVTAFVNAMEKLKEEFHSAYETVCESLSLLKTSACQWIHGKESAVWKSPSRYHFEVKKSSQSKQ